MDWIDYVLSQSNPPLTISTSYGDDEQTGPDLSHLHPFILHQAASTVPRSYAERVCSGFAQLGKAFRCPVSVRINYNFQGARGVSLLFASGDGGVGDGNSNPTNQSCFTNDGQNRATFLPIFPAS